MSTSAALAVLAACLAGAAIALHGTGPARAGRRALRDLGVATVRGDGAQGRAGTSFSGETDLLGRHRLGFSLLAAGAPVLLLGGAVGVVAGAVAALLAYRALANRVPAHERRRREAVAQALPHAVDLLAVALSAGAAPSSALAVVAAAVDPPVADELEAAEHGLRLGRDPVQVWRGVAARPGMAGLGRAMARAVETGASVSDALHRLAEDLHATSAADAESRARTVGVRAAAPLGLCLLPAFVLVGVVPLVAGTLTALLMS